MPPHFLVIGAMKAGSTSLHDHLAAHPRVFMSDPKEPEYFSVHYDEAGARQRYGSLFENAKPDDLCGEASTGYSRWPAIPDVPRRIHDFSSEMRLIYLIREPVARAWSHYVHRMQERVILDEETLPLAEALEAIPEIVHASLYLSQIERYLEFFPREQMLLLTLDELRSEPAATLERLQSFLGLEVVDLALDPVHSNRADDRVERWKAEAALARARDSRLGSALRSVVPRPLRSTVQKRLRDSAQARRALGRLGARHAPAPELSCEDRELLRRRFEAPTRELASFLGRELW